MTVTTTAQQTITPATPVHLKPPLFAYGVNTLVLDNLSGYLLQVNVGADQFWHAPLVENAYDLTSSPGADVVVQAVALPGDTETNGTLAPTWHSELVGQLGKNFPIALSGPAEIAAAIVASGLPIVYTATLIGTFTASAGNPVIQDVHQYGSILFAPQSGGGAADLQVDWLPGLIQDFIPVLGGSILLPVLGTQIELAWNAAGSVTFQLWGTNQRAPFSTHGFRQYSSNGWRAQTASVAMVANTTYPMSTISGQTFQGPCTVLLRVASTTVPGFIVANLANGGAVLLFDTNGLNAGVTGIGASKNVQTALPENTVSLSFICGATAGTQQIFLDLVPTY